ncbi:glycosyltransferase [Lachnospiraceae bacterium 29-84]
MDAIERIGILCSEIENGLFLYGDYVSENMMTRMNELLWFVHTVPEVYRAAVEKQLLGLLPKSFRYSKVWLYSAIMRLTNNAKIFEQFQEYVLQERGFTANVKFFLYYQFRREIFVQSDFGNNNMKYLQWKLLKQIVGMFRREMEDMFVPISEKECDNNMVLVITEQILGNTHGPTKIVLERCKILLEIMHKKVLLINTAEVLTPVGSIPFCQASFGNYLKEYLEKEELEWGNVTIPFFQCENNMPNVHTLRILIQTIRNMKPGLVIAFGGSSILINLVATIFPVLNIGMSSDLEDTMATCQALSRPLNDMDRELLAKVGVHEEHVIQSMVTFKPLHQTSVLTRTELGLPEDKFILAIVGGRLDIEINEQFMDMLSCAIDDDIRIAIIGAFRTCDRYIEKFPKLRNKIYCLGYTDDFLAWIEVCDLFVNPCRKGGGTSGLEALFKGVPVVTLPYGDVAVNVGKEFWTESYDTMSRLIRRYKNDTIYCNEMRKKARKRVNTLSNVAEDFQHTIHVFEQRIKSLRNVEK